MVVMVVIAFFTEILKWQWHYDPALNSLYLTASSHVHLYIFFKHAFAIPIFSPLFDPTTTLREILLYIAHPVAMQPHMAQPTTAPPQLAPLSPPESDPSKISVSSYSSDLSVGYSPSGPGFVDIIENGFLSLILLRGVYQTLFEIAVCTGWSYFDILLYALGRHL